MHLYGKDSISKDIYRYIPFDIPITQSNKYLHIIKQY